MSPFAPSAREQRRPVSPKVHPNDQLSGRQFEDSTSEATAAQGRGPLVLRFMDIAVLIVAVPVFVIADLPLAGFAVGALAWLAQRGIQEVAERRAARLLEQGNRRNAMGIVAATTMGRVWLVALSILLVGKLADRSDGLAAAVLTLVLVTVYFAGLGLSKLFEPQSGGAPAAPTPGVAS
jgi:hypothetical protein